MTTKFKKGTSGNANGRPKGSKNKATLDLRLTIKSFLEANAADLQNNYELLEPKERLQFFEKILKFALPIQQQQKIDFAKLSDDDLNLIINSIEI